MVKVYGDLYFSMLFIYLYELVFYMHKPFYILVVFVTVLLFVDASMMSDILLNIEAGENQN